MDLTEQEQKQLEEAITNIKAWLQEKNPESLSAFDEMVYLSQSGDKSALGVLGFMLASYMAGLRQGVDTVDPVQYPSLN